MKWVIAHPLKNIILVIEIKRLMTWPTWQMRFLKSNMWYASTGWARHGQSPGDKMSRTTAVILTAVSARLFPGVESK